MRTIAPSRFFKNELQYIRVIKIDAQEIQTTSILIGKNRSDLTRALDVTSFMFVKEFQVVE
jgi:hypothetical protein